MELQTGDVLNVHNKLVWYKPLSYVSAGIRFFTKAYYNHTSIAIEIWGRMYVAEALPKGIAIKPYEEWVDKEKNWTVYRPKFKHDERMTAIKIMIKQGYVGYDYSSLLFYQIIYQVTGFYFGRKGKKAEKRLFCSEYIAWIYKEKFKEWWKVTPIDIVERKDLFEEVKI